ncbi:hypothetical protein niasHT_014038 [Heterodera trifolii]|uniref:Uncharacterized protein n=1 Tax=Heterodera trifolii TaxID=157864 RepID=A0ABD2LG76_9BILA
MPSLSFPFHFSSLSLFVPIFFLCLFAFGTARTLRRDRQEAASAADHLHQNHHRDTTDYSSGVFVDSVPITSTGNGKAFEDGKRRHRLSEKLRTFNDNLWWLEMEFTQRN